MTTDNSLSANADEVNEIIMRRNLNPVFKDGWSEFYQSIKSHVVSGTNETSEKLNSWKNAAKALIEQTYTTSDGASRSMGLGILIVGAAVGLVIIGRK